MCILSMWLNRILCTVYITFYMTTIKEKRVTMKQNLYFLMYLKCVCSKEVEYCTASNVVSVLFSLESVTLHVYMYTRLLN